MMTSGMHRRHFEGRHLVCYLCPEIPFLFSELKELARERELRLSLAPTEEVLQKCRLRDLKKQQMQKFLWSFFQHAFLLLLFILISTNIHVDEILQSNESLRRSITTGSCFDSSDDEFYKKFVHIKNRSDWWLWAYSELMSVTYNRDSSFSSNFLFCDTNAVLIGLPRIREYSVNPKDCDMSGSVMLAKNMSLNSLLGIIYCYPGYEDQVNHPTNFRGYDDKKYEWDAHYLAVLRGLYSQYSYTSAEYNLPDKKFSAIFMLSTLQIANLILQDKSTRGLITEFCLYHPQYQLFSSVSYIAEFPPVSGANGLVFIQSTYLDRYRNIWSYFTMYAEVLLLPLAMHFMVKTFLFLYKCQFLFWKSIWGCLDMLLAMLLCSYVVCLMLRALIAEDLLWQLKVSYYKEFVNLKSVCSWDNIIMSVLSLAIFIQILRCLRLLSFFWPCRRLGLIVAKAFKDIMAITIAFVVPASMAFIFLGWIWLSTKSPFFQSFYYASITVFSLVTQMNSRLIVTKDLPTESRIFANIYISAIILTLVVFVGAFYFAAFSHALRTLKINPRPVEITIPDIFSYIFSNVSKCFKCLKRKSQSQTEKEAHLSSKAPMHFSEVQSMLTELESSMTLLNHKLLHVAESLDIQDPITELKDSDKKICSPLSRKDSSVRRRKGAKFLAASESGSFSLDGFTEVSSYRTEAARARDLVAGLCIHPVSQSLSSRGESRHIDRFKDEYHLNKFLDDVQYISSDNISGLPFGKYGKHIAKLKRKKIGSFSRGSKEPQPSASDQRPSASEAFERLRNAQSFGPHDASKPLWELDQLNITDEEDN